MRRHHLGSSREARGPARTHPSDMLALTVHGPAGVLDLVVPAGAVGRRRRRGVRRAVPARLRARPAHAPRRGAPARHALADAGLGPATCSSRAGRRARPDARRAGRRASGRAGTPAAPGAVLRAVVPRRGRGGRARRLVRRPHRRPAVRRDRAAARGRRRCSACCPVGRLARAPGGGGARRSPRPRRSRASGRPSPSGCRWSSASPPWWRRVTAAVGRAPWTGGPRRRCGSGSSPAPRSSSSPALAPSLGAGPAGGLGAAAGRWRCWPPGSCPAWPSTCRTSTSSTSSGSRSPPGRRATGRAGGAAAPSSRPTRSAWSRPAAPRTVTAAAAAICGRRRAQRADAAGDRHPAGRPGRRPCLVVFCAGAALLLAARSYRHRGAGRCCAPPASAAGRPCSSCCSGCSSDQRPVALGGRGDRASAALLVVVAVAIGRGWRSAWWSRRAEVAEGLARRLRHRLAGRRRPGCSGPCGKSSSGFSGSRPRVDPGCPARDRADGSPDSHHISSGSVPPRGKEWRDERSTQRDGTGPGTLTRAAGLVAEAKADFDRLSRSSRRPDRRHAGPVGRRGRHGVLRTSTRPGRRSRHHRRGAQRVRGLADRTDRDNTNTDDDQARRQRQPRPPRRVPTGLTATRPDRRHDDDHRRTPRQPRGLDQAAQDLSARSRGSTTGSTSSRTSCAPLQSDWTGQAKGQYDDRQARGTPPSTRCTPARPDQHQRHPVQRRLPRRRPARRRSRSTL